ncbi:hypothetical protein [Massilia sp. DD77]|uniref:hypothetical protein n=1 Tax=Massilia sp. DD77 TaxID=3109349 RepID=UPI002FFF7B3F
MRRLPRAALLLGILAGSAQAAPPSLSPPAVCGVVGCGASGVAPALLKEAVRPALAHGAPERGRRSERHMAPAPVRNPWERQLGGRGGEDYSCILSVGIGGTTARDGFLATRLFGRTQVWRAEPLARPQE